jgi:hypothetical protein
MEFSMSVVASELPYGDMPKKIWKQGWARREQLSPLFSALASQRLLLRRLLCRGSPSLSNKHLSIALRRFETYAIS